MKWRIDDAGISDFLFSPRCRVHRHLLLQAVVLLITVNVFWYEPLQSLPFVQRFFGWLVYLITIDAVIYANVYLLIPRYLLKNRIGVYSLAALGVILVVMGLTVTAQGLLYESKLPTQYGGSLAMFVNGFSGIVTIGFLTAGVAAIMLFRHWILYSVRIDELESATLQSELKHLRNQINPHFLFNMLNNANVLMRKDPAEASEVLFKLEDLLRYQMNDSSREKIALHSDIHFLNDYLNLEKIRRDNFEYTITQEGDIDGVWLPPLLFIPFVENAVKHNFDSENPSYVRVSFVVDGDRLDFQCVNSKPAVVDKKKVGGLGLANIRRRLALLYPGRYLMERLETENSYTIKLHLEL
ncbi:sensor histidine kinase [Bacteroides sp.]